MCVKVNKYLPAGIIGITLYPLGIYVSKDKYLDNKKILNHEYIHWEQQKELPFLFYIIYGVEWLIKYIYFNGQGYKNLAAEREAYFYENDLNYLKTRKRYAWIKYIIQKP